MACVTFTRVKLPLQRYPRSIPTYTLLPNQKSKILSPIRFSLRSARALRAIQKKVHIFCSWSVSAL